VAGTQREKAFLQLRS